nr:uncharacterized protein LOC128694082 isoform X2 [Cherax quadricarinatus]
MREKRSKCHEKRQRTHRRSRRFVHRLEGRWLRSEVQVRGGEVGSLYKGDTFAATTIPVHNKTSVRETRETYGRTVVVTMTRDEEMAKEEKRRPLWLCCTSRPVPRKFTFLQLDYLLHMSLPVVRLVPRYLHNAVLLLYMLSSVMVLCCVCVCCVAAAPASAVSAASVPPGAAVPPAAAAAAAAVTTAVTAVKI